MKCPNCGTEAAPDAKFCTNCGADLTAVNETGENANPMDGAPKDMVFRCPNCGAEILPGDKFCTKCGAVLVAEPEGAENGQPGQDADNQEGPQGQNEQANQNGNPANPVQPNQANWQSQPSQPTQQNQANWQSQPQNQGNTAMQPNGSAQQPMQVPPQYAQQAYYPQQNYAPQQQAPQQPAPEKPKRGKTPVWAWVVIGVLAAAIIFCIIWFFVVPNVNHSGSSNVAETSAVEHGGNGNYRKTSRNYINGNSPDASSAEEQLSYTAQDIIDNTKKGWRNPSLMSGNMITHIIWSGNDLAFILEADIDASQSYRGIADLNRTYYYTYVKFENVYKENGTYHYENAKQPHGKLLNLYTDVSGDHHKVAGYATEAEARSAAGV